MIEDTQKFVAVSKLTPRVCDSDARPGSLLKALDKTLIPDAKNPELKALLVRVRPAFEAHLEHARKLQAELSRSGA